jgi:hypothetical protein
MTPSANEKAVATASRCSFKFDLWSYDDVTAHADDILARLRAGTMPCDGAWPDEQVDTFQGWIDAGKPQ